MPWIEAAPKPPEAAGAEAAAAAAAAAAAGAAAEEQGCEGGDARSDQENVRSAAP